jgi:hypothetical protein
VAGIAAVCTCVTPAIAPTASGSGYRPHVTGGASVTVTIGDFLHDEPGGYTGPLPSSGIAVTGGTTSTMAGTVGPAPRAYSQKGISRWQTF